MTWQEAGIVFTFLLGVWNLAAHARDGKRTSFINTVTSERVKWIQNTRMAIADLCGRAYYWVMTQEEISRDESNNVRKEIDRLTTLAKLQLNPNEEPSRRLIQLIDRMPNVTHSTQRGPMKSLMDEITSASQEVLKAE